MDMVWVCEAPLRHCLLGEAWNLAQEELLKTRANPPTVDLISSVGVLDLLVVSREHRHMPTTRRLLASRPGFIG